MIFSAYTAILILCLSMAQTCTSKKSCRLGWSYSPSSGTCLKKFHTKLKFSQAVAECERGRAKIVSIFNKNMNDFVEDLLKYETEQYFIGLNDEHTEESFKWIGTNKLANYSNWAKHEPDGGRSQNCVAYHHIKIRGHRKWIDVFCKERKSYICEACPTGTYGTYCDHNCNKNCLKSLNTCNGINGHCLHGCVPGYRGDKCDTKCLSGTFGSACSQQCNESCGGAGNPCHHIHGKCSENCDIGMFGAFCESKCSKHCFRTDKACAQNNGSCIDGCKPGYDGARCETTCSNGTFGSACSQQCNEHCGGAGNPCHHIGGECSENCDLGFIGAFCGSICPNGTFGHKCSRQCNEHCGGTGNLCDHQYGMCINDCDIGFQGVQCESMCSNNTYGNKCTKNCSVLCNEQACDPVTGACSLGCVAGYTGDKCVQKVIEGGRLPRWFRIVLILGGTVGGVIFALCLSRLSKKESEPHEEESHLYEDGEDPLPDFDDDYEDEIAQYYYDDVEYDEYDYNNDLDLDYFDDGFFDDNIDNYGEIVTQV